MLAWEKVPQGLLSNSTIDELAQFLSDWPQVEYLLIYPPIWGTTATIALPTHMMDTTTPL
jgi:hypothetical protein